MKPHCPCHDCGIDTSPSWAAAAAYEWYMVSDAVWRAAKGPRHGYLCIGCLEHRLGRQLDVADFIDTPVNSLGPEVEHHAWSQRTPRLRDRLTPRQSPASTYANFLPLGDEAA